MSEVEKMYENAGINTISQKTKDCNYCYYYEEAYDAPCHVCTVDKCPFEKNITPPFTAEKQLKLYKYLCKPFLITTRYYFDEFSITAENTFEWKTMTKVSAIGKTYEECIAKLVNTLWQDLTEEEKQQVKGILE